MLTDRLQERELARWAAARILARNAVSAPFFAKYAEQTARASAAMAQRFLAGGRLYAFGRGSYATDAQHVAVEFVHPVIVGKRALPAVDLSLDFARWSSVVVGPQDMAIGFGPPQGDPEVQRALDVVRARGALTLAFPGEADFGTRAADEDPHLHQELVEALCHTLYESVHVFFEHQSLGHDVGASSFLYPYLGRTRHDPDRLALDVAASICAKGADGDALRETVASEQAVALEEATRALFHCVARGGKILACGNGGSATDATDFALDCVAPEDDALPVPALSLSLEPATLTAIANDVGTDVIFVRQLIAQANSGDALVVFSTSGGSRNVLAVLEEARKRSLLTVALLGYDGGEVVRRALADHTLVVRSDYIPRIQEAQAAIYHTLREGLEILRRAA